jgi:hypothetical protein
LAAKDGSAASDQIATSGTVNTLVSTLNGNISVGDMVAASPFDGIGMRATLGMHVVGLAQAGFNPNSSGAAVRQVTDKDGKSHQISVGYIPIDIVITVDGTGNSSGQQLNSLQKVAQNITGRVIPTARLVVSLIIAVVAVLTVMILIYSAIYGGIISIGRNPLAKHAIFMSLAGVGEMIIILSALTVIIIYFLVR